MLLVLLKLFSLFAHIVAEVPELTARIILAAHLAAQPPWPPGKYFQRRSAAGAAFLRSFDLPCHLLAGRLGRPWRDSSVHKIRGNDFVACAFIRGFAAA